MSKSTPQKKKVIITTTPTSKQVENKRPNPTVATRSRTSAAAPKMKTELIFGRINYIWMGIGILLITIGLFMMSGGEMPSPDIWEPGRIYSFTRITLSPIFILAGLVIQIYAIFKREKVAEKEPVS